MYFEDLPQGTRFDTASRTLSREDIVSFAQEWDAQPFHVDAEAAKSSPYGQIIASGFHTILVAFNLVLDASDWSDSSMGSPGMSEVRWLAPVYPGDTLRVSALVDKATPSRSKTDRGFVDISYEIVNQNDALVASYRATHMLRRRGA